MSAKAKAPRKRKAGGAPEDSELAEDKAKRQRQDEEGARLRAQAYNMGMFSKSAYDGELQSLKTPKALRACHGGAVVKKASRKKSKHIFAFPGLFVPGAAGVVGTMAQLDTLTPVLYMEFPPHGRLKLCGTTVYPKTNLLSLQCKSNPATETNELVCEDVFDRVVVFSDYAWVGHAADNPEEKPITPIPYEVAKMINGGGGGGSSSEQGARRKAAAKTTTPVPGVAAATAATAPATADVVNLVDDSSDGEGGGRRRRRSTAKRVNYNLEQKLTRESSQSSDSDDDILNPKLRHRTTSHASSSSAAAKPKARSICSDEDDGAGNEEAEEKEEEEEKEEKNSGATAGGLTWSPSVKSRGEDSDAVARTARRRSGPITLAAERSTPSKRKLSGSSAAKGKDKSAVVPSDVEKVDEEGDKGEEEAGEEVKAGGRSKRTKRMLVESDSDGEAGGATNDVPPVAHLSSSSDDDWDAMIAKAARKVNSTGGGAATEAKQPVVELISSDDDF